VNCTGEGSCVTGVTCDAEICDLSCDNSSCANNVVCGVAGGDTASCELTCGLASCGASVSCDVIGGDCDINCLEAGACSGNVACNADGQCDVDCANNADCLDSVSCTASQVLNDCL
jgi:hypothetical protein